MLRRSDGLMFAENVQSGTHASTPALLGFPSSAKSIVASEPGAVLEQNPSNERTIHLISRMKLDECSRLALENCPYCRALPGCSSGRLRGNGALHRPSC